MLTPIRFDSSTSGDAWADEKVSTPHVDLNVVEELKIEN